MNIQQIKQKSIAEIKSAFLESQNESLINQTKNLQLDIELILSEVLNQNRTWITFHRDFELSEEQISKIENAIEKRKTGLPIAYITHKKEFFGLDFYVDENVLIPKPDTELLVELSTDFINKLLINNHSLSIIDMCCGSGCVGISVLRNLIDKNIEMTFVDISQNALEITKKNVKALLSDISDSQNIKINFVKSNLFEELRDNKFDFILTNPPYVPHDETLQLLKDGRSEPILALDGDVDENSAFCGSNDGLSLIRRLIPQAFEHLKENGTMLMETGEYNAQETAILFEKAGFKNIRIEKDMNEMLRDVIGTKGNQNE